MKPKHTPGPWGWWTEKGGRPKGYDIACLCSIERRDILSKYGGEGEFALGKTDEDIANARLIVAAPDLLEVLCALVNSPNAKQNAMWDAARSAISKAIKGDKK